MMNLMIVRSPSLYNGIIGPPGLRKIQAVPSTVHEMLKFPVQGGIAMLHSSTMVPTECRMVAEVLAKPRTNEPTGGAGIKRKRRHILGPCRQYEGNSRMSEKGGSSDKVTIPKDAERSAKPQRKAGKPE
ncbi:hypothetical protein Tco_1430124 [Tanacetum coccineum]